MSEVRMPKMGDGMEEGTILRWMKHEGETVSVDEPIAEIETDKANVEMPAEESGTITRIVVKEGQTVPVGAVIAEINGVGDAGKGARSPASAPDRVTTGEGGTPGPGEPQTTTPPPPQPAEHAAPPAEAGPSAERVKATPLARRMAREAGIDLALIQGTGPGGQIRQRDVQAFIDRGGKPGGLPSIASELPKVTSATPAAAAATEAPSSTTPAREAPRPAVPSLTGRDVKVSKMRAAIARRTVLSKQTVPHFYVTMAIEMDRALGLLDAMNATATPETKITVNDLIVKAAAGALAKFPDVNASWVPDDTIRYYEMINISIAVPTDQGLTMPVITDCGRKTLRQVSQDAKRLIARARAGQITPQEMSGGTFSVSNMGMLGVESFSAIINPPESAILAVGSSLPEVVVGEEGEFVVRSRMRVTLSCDHRTVDGALGARFLGEVRRLLESPLELLA